MRSKISSFINLFPVLGFCYILLFIGVNSMKSQVSYGSAASYSLRRTTPTYTGNVIQIRRACDNATTNIGFTPCGELDTVTLKKFVVGSNPLSSITTSAATAYSLRKLRCAYPGNAINVRRSCDNATKDIGFDSNGDLDTATLKTFVMASNPLSAISAASAAAFSLRKLRCAFAGSAIRIRSSAAGSPTVDVGFTANGDLDTASMKTFVGANNAFVTIWYDQSGNGNNAVQPSAGNQPEIMVAGKINRQGGSTGQPAIIFSAALTSYLVIPYAAGTLNFSSASTTNAVFARTAVPTGDAAIFDQVYASNNISVALAWNDGTGASMPLSIGQFPSSSWSFVALPTDVALNTNNIITGTMLSGAANTTTMNLYQNGTVAATASNKLTIGAIAAQPFNIGKRWDLPDYAPMNMQELIVFTSVLSSTDRQYLEWGQSQYYAISGPVLSSTLPAGTPSAFVTKWYDQSSNSRDASQATTANQPRIINTGLIEKQNSIPAVYFAGLTNSLFTANFTAFATAACFNAVAKVNSNLTYNTIVNKTNNNNFPCPLDFYNNSVLVGNGVSGQYNSFAATQTFNSAQPLGIWTMQANGTIANGVNAYYNGASIVSNQTAAFYSDAAGAGLYLGSRFDGVTGLNGWISEVLTFGAIPSSTDRAFLEWTQGQYYNISGITLGTIPAGAPSAFVTTWYDQSGNLNHATQPATGNQPKIVNSGAMSLQNGRPAISLDGTSTWLIQSTMSVTQPYSLNSIATRTVNGGGAGGYQRLVNISATGDGYGYQGVFSGNYATFNGNGATWNDLAANIPLTLVALNAQAIMTMVSATGVAGLVSSVNGPALNLKNGTSVAATGFLLGGAWSTNNTSQLWPGTISEFHIFSSALSSTRRTLLETNQASNYARVVSNSKYTPLTSSSYNLFVNGIGRESATDSVGGTRSTAGMGLTVTTAATAFLKDNGDYITYGMNCPATPFLSSSNLPATVVQRWQNDWYLNKTDVGSNNGLMTFFFDYSDYGAGAGPGLAANYVLLYRSSSAGTFTIVPSTTVSTVGDRVLFAVDGANITTNYFYTIGTKDMSASPLPIELIDFSCNLINPKTVELTWKTASESNSHYFSVERSADAINYQSIGKVNAAGNSVTMKHYSLKDESALRDISYYRLKSVDLDESYKYSSVCSVTNQSDDGTGDIIIYPNPTNSSITIDFNHSVYSQPDTYNLMDIVGKKIEISSIRNNNIITIDMSMLQPGLYILEVIKGNQKSVKKITLQK